MRARKRMAMVVAAMAAAGAAAGATPAAASVDWLVAAGPGGTAHFAFSQPAAGGAGQILERRMAPDGTLSDVQSVSPAYRSAYRQFIGVDSGGNAVITWIDESGESEVLFARRRLADGTLTPIQRLSPPGVNALTPALAVEPDGDAYAVWTRNIDGRLVIQGRRRTAGGGLGPVQTLSPTSADAYTADVAVAPSGAVSVAWIRDLTAADRVAQMRTVAPNGALSGYQRLSAVSPHIANPLVTVSDAGTAVVAWERDAGEDGWVLESRARAADGTLAAAQAIASLGAGPRQHATGGNAGGRTVFAWTQADGALKGRVRTPTGALGPAFPLGTVPGRRVRAAVDRDGHASFAWETTTEEKPAVQLQRRSLTGALGPVRTLSADGEHANVASLVVDGGGKATVAWSVFPTGALMARTVTAGGVVSPPRVLNGP